MAPSDQGELYRLLGNLALQGDVRIESSCGEWEVRFSQRGRPGDLCRCREQDLLTATRALTRHVESIYPPGTSHGPRKPDCPALRAGRPPPAGCGGAAVRGVRAGACWG